MYLRCPTCGGAGCDRCGGDAEMPGHIAIDRCPHAIIGREPWEILRAAKQAERGLLPVAGGTEDQSRSLMDACDLVYADQAAWRHELKIPAFPFPF